MVKSVSVGETIKSVTDYQQAIDDGANPNEVTTDQVGTYTKDQVDAKLALIAGSGDLPLSQFGDLGFIPPNISVKYEGAATYNPGIAYNVEADGSRNYLRAGCDGSQYGVYLCKYNVNALGNVEGYSPLANIWQPSYLPDTQRPIAVINGLETQVALLVRDSANNRSFFAVSERTGTLDPAAHATGLKGIIGSTWTPSLSCVLAHKGSLYHFHYNLNDTQGVALSIVVDKMETYTGNPASAPTQLLGWTGKDIHGNQFNSWDAIAVSKYYITGVPGLGNDSVYFEWTDNLPATAPMIQPPSIHATFLSGDTYRLFFVHEQWVSLASGASIRVLVSRQVDVNLITRTFTWQANSLGPTQAVGDTNANSIVINGLASYPDSVKYGLSGLGNVRPSFGRCPRTKEVLTQTNSVVYGTSQQQYLGVVPDAVWLDPKQRNFSGKPPYAYKGNYPTPLTVSIRIPKVLAKDKLRVSFDGGQANITGINYNDTTVFNYPDGTTSTWALDTGREATGPMETSRMLTEIDVNFNVRLSNTFTRDAPSGSSNLDQYGIGTNDTTVTAAVFDAIEASARAELGGVGTIRSMHTVVAIPRILTKKLTNKFVSLTLIIMGDGAGFNFLTMGDKTGWSGGTLSAVSISQKRLSEQVATGVISVVNVGAGGIGLTIAEQTDYTFVGGSIPFSTSYPGNSGHPSQAVGFNDSDGAMFAIRDYQGHGYANQDELFALPSSLGVVAMNTSVDSLFVQTTLTVMSYGRTKTGVLSGATTKAKVIATQAVKGSWNVYFSEEVYCQIAGIKGRAPKKTVNLTSVIADPSNKTFYIYVQLTDGQFDYLVTNGPQSADRNRLLVGTVATDTTHVVSVTVFKVVGIDGFSLSFDKAPFAIPASSGNPTTTGALNWTFP
ncbi:hypothetical protein [Erwinia phage vB_Ea277G]|nr:hypothetical protein [Erwinia phage vB_Ea277G]